VIQPFDKGRFDKRYRDVFAPAIEAAGLEPYRVDRDPGASIIIEEIETRIRDADVCLADITTDNPNVWFELGYALASGKEVCLICADERVERYPFDVQHRLILKYSCESRSDFDELKEKVSERLRAILSKRQKLQKISSVSPLKDTEGLSQHEIITLCTIVENRTGPTSGISLDRIIEDMKALGYNKLAVNLGIEKLLMKDMIEITSEEGWDDWNKDTYTYDAYRLTPLGFEWLLKNEQKLNLRREEQVSNANDNLDDEIPF
jgi:nucleoside 2-deoxyribosyltransferase